MNPLKSFALVVGEVPYNVVLVFAAPGSVAPWQAHAYLEWQDERDDPAVCISSGVDPNTALQALAVELSEL